LGGDESLSYPDGTSVAQEGWPTLTPEISDIDQIKTVDIAVIKQFAVVQTL
jgi:hypothetical protein